MNAASSRRLVRLSVTLSIALIAVGLVLLATVTPTLDKAMANGDEVPYDAIFKMRANTPRPQVPIVLVEVDDESLKEAASNLKGNAAMQWPWARGYWGYQVHYFAEQGARCVVFDLHFTEPAVRGEDDDEQFAGKLDASPIPVVISAGAAEHRFAPPVKKPVILGDVDVTPEANYRTYEPDTPRGPSLALAAVRAAGLTPKLPTDQPIRLLYHGAHRWGDNQSVYPTVRASKAYFASFNTEDALPPDTFKDKIVIVGATATGLGDLKTAPVGGRYPGVEVHATAIDNLLNGERIRVAPRGLIVLFSLLLALSAAGGVILARPLPAKVATIAVSAGALTVLCVLPLLLSQPYWLPPMVPGVAMTLSIVAALIFTYRIEDARAKLLLKALGQCVAPHVAAELADEPSRLRVGGEQREITVLFSDIAGFTDLTERLRERIEPVLNFYLAEMSQKAFAEDGTIDKFIGDAMMIFWNAPLKQFDHATRACRVALAIAEHEKKIGPELAELGAANLRTRIGINTGPVVVGFFGSAQRLSYTAIGDAVNLAARLEPGNKIYATQILVSQATKEKAQKETGDELLFRRIDRLRVYGRDEPAEVHELMGESAKVDESLRWLAERFDVAIEAYFSQNWSQALEELDAILVRCPDDGPAELLRQRAIGFRYNPPAADWDGVYTATGK